MGRISVNQTIPPRTYFGDSLSAPLSYKLFDQIIDLCSTKQSESSTRNSSIDGNYDMANFIWHEGDEGPFQNTSGKIRIYLQGVNILK